jgi:DNA uptake protein ComE-like DNA-binding protein
MDLMKNRSISSTLVCALLLAGSWSMAAQAAASAPQAAASHAKAAAPKHKAAPKVKLVDINAASVEELSKLPNITAEDAAKIVAGRPYGSKAWLVTQNVIPEAKFHSISALVVAKQPFSDATKSVAVLKKAQKAASK